jgi:hypothetical protein
MFPCYMRLEVLRIEHRQAEQFRLPAPGKQGVYRVDLFGVVRRLNSTNGNSSTHAPAVMGIPFGHPLLVYLARLLNMEKAQQRQPEEVFY